jgi:hypothetical protein
MSFRPTRKIFPPARYADDAGELELSSRCKAVTSVTVSADSAPLATRPSSTPATTPSLPPESSPYPPTDTEDDTTDSARRSSKRTSHDTIKSTLSNDSVITIATSDDTDADADAHNKVRNPKKAKTSAMLGDQAIQGEHSDISIIDIEDIKDPDDERLNKSEPTADIKHFFTAIPSLPGQTKRRMKCTLCT